MTHRTGRLAMLALSTALVALTAFPGGLGAPPSDAPGQGQADEEGNESATSSPSPSTTSASPTPSHAHGWPSSRDDVVVRTSRVEYVWYPTVVIVSVGHEGAERIELEGWPLTVTPLRPHYHMVVETSHHHDHHECEEADRPTDQNP